MSRHTGPRLKIMRAFNTELPGLSRKSIAARPNPPGQHGAKGLRRRKSDYGVALIERQKLRFNYGVSETHLRKLMTKARRMQGPPGDNLLQLLECRLDNAVFRAGMAPTIPAARQLVSHCHVLLNGRSANIPSIRLRVGDEVTLREKSRSIPLTRETITSPSLDRPEWLVWNETAFTAKIARLPDADEVPFPIEVQLVVQYYANRI